MKSDTAFQAAIIPLHLQAAAGRKACIIPSTSPNSFATISSQKRRCVFFQSNFVAEVVEKVFLHITETISLFMLKKNKINVITNHVQNVFLYIF